MRLSLVLRDLVQSSYASRSDCHVACAEIRAVSTSGFVLQQGLNNGLISFCSETVHDTGGPVFLLIVSTNTDHIFAFELLGVIFRSEQLDSGSDVVDMVLDVMRHMVLVTRRCNTASYRVLELVELCLQQVLGLIRSRKKGKPTLVV